MHDELLKWINYLVTEFDVDGLRLDTVMYVPKNYWKKFTDKAGVYAVKIFKIL